ncbi:MAG: helix-turn-helix domain-containing protein, partial [Dokdonella sp.]
MPWDVQNTMSLRQEFVRLASHEQANRRELCQRFGISPQTGYKWLARLLSNPGDRLEDRSRRPLSSPRSSDPDVEVMVTALRAEHSAWGGRKISRRLFDTRGVVVAPSTVT